MVLEGGYNYWNKIILNPEKPQTFSDDEILKYKKNMAVAEYLGGSSSLNIVSTDTISKSSKKRAKRKKKKKKLEGC